MTQIPKEVEDYIESLEGADQILEQLEELHSKKRKSAIDWYKEFEKAEVRGFFPDHCERSALNWGCCAIGARLQFECPDKAKEIALRKDNGSPRDSNVYLTDEATKLGRDFYDAVCKDDVLEARRLFNQIHKLPRILLTEKEIEYKLRLEKESKERLLEHKKLLEKYDALPFYKKWGNERPSLTEVVEQ